MGEKSDCFETEFVPIEKLLSLSGVLSDYLQKDESLQHLVSTFQDLDSLHKNIAARKANPINRQVLSKVLYRQNFGFQLHKKQSENLELIKSDLTFCMTTAHQTNLFGGPLYFIQKAISTIKACELAQEQYPNNFFVPIFWLGSEDHDFDELNHTYINDKKVIWKDEQGGAVGRYSTSSLTSVLQEVEQLLGNSQRANKVIGLLRRAYEQKKTIAQATRLVLHELLGKYGLLVVDGDDSDLKQLMVNVFAKELQEQFSHTAVEISSAFLDERYGKHQAHAREINLFYLTDNSRERIIKMKNGFRIEESDRFFTEEELLTELKQHPERFSPNVFLRPVMQEICLPNLVYIGGGGELSYWLQLKPIFDAVNQPFPMLGLRDTAVYLPKKINKKLNQLQISVNDCFQPKEQLIQALVQQHSTNNLSLTASRKSIISAMQEMEQQAKAIDSTLQASAKAEQQRMMNALENLEKKMMRAEKKNQQVIVDRIDMIYNEIFPNNSLQERVQNFTEYYVEYGEEWIEWMKDQFNLFDQQLKVMKEA